MKRRFPMLGLALATSSLRAATLAPTPAPQLSPADLQFFESRVRPVFVERCYKCHSHDADKVKGGLMLDTQEGMLHGGDTGPAIVPGKPDDSLLIDAIRYTDENLQMPPKGDKLSDQQVADLTEWVRRGAPDPRTGVAQGSSLVYGGVGRQHWSFLPVQNQPVPEVKDASWCQTPVDNFVLAKLEAAGMKPNPPADKRTLIRRVTFDLIGLPPTEAEVQVFLADDSPDAYAKVVDRLLASPHYGERWARYWLDVARYADTKGDPAKKQQSDFRYPDAWTYRDYVIDAFNQDKPYNQFILEQLAADRLILADEAQAKKNHTAPKVDQSCIAALGFLTLGNEFDGSFNDVVNDRIDVTTKAFLGLTVTCARCHDHKFDPIPTKDYYSLFGVFANTIEPQKESQEPAVHPVSPTPELLAYLQKLGDLESKDDKLEGDLAMLKRSHELDRGKRQAIYKQEAEVNSDITELEINDPGAPPRAVILADSPHPHDYPVLIRGEATNKGPIVPRRFLEILSGPKRPEWKKDSGRLELAEDIVDPNNPLTARVLVNRVWQQHFGVGFVPTPDDLGNQSAPPSHPELLDYLARRFMAEGWSLKKLQRLIVMSAVYQESSAGNLQYADGDPDNKLLWRYNLHRLDFEEIHDALLQIAGTLDLDQIGGKPMQIGSADFAKRRALYTYIDRRNPPELFTQFDFPNPNVPSGRRYTTTVPQQSLFLMNSPMVIETARALTHRPEFTDLSSDEERVASLYEAVYQRLPTPAETKLCLHYVEANPGGTSINAPNRPVFPGAQKAAEAQARLAERVAQNAGRQKNAPQVEPAAAAYRSRAPLDAWTKLAHALFQTSEAIFIN
jgi:mono/diheme cytochrome c family protein